MDTDRNLLFAVLALQADLIDANQLVEACMLWSARKNLPLADVLLERGWILPADKAHLDYLLQRKLTKHGGDAKASLAGIADDIKRSLAAVGDADIEQSLASLPQPNQAVPTATIDYIPGSHDRYTLQRLHATGGIGRVWLAHDSDLDRDIAFKELRPEKAEDATLRARFLNEARIAGQLEHPGTVPVYELGRRPENQQPFYTMRFVKGRTLTEAARAYHQKRLAGQAESLDFLTLLNAFVTVCNTVAYAHSRGVIHRDLKGQNVVLGDFGEVVVLDWGLAKLVNQHESETHAPSLRVDQESDAVADLTVQGQLIGTPAYMAPEQAAGRLDLIDHRTDIYGLGAILYEILTAQPPVRGSNAQEVLRKVREEEPFPPSRLCSVVPPALETVCLRALAKQSADRYASASELAQEVQRWQEVQRRQAEEALRQSEALYHSLVETLPLQVWRKDRESRFTFGNERFCEATARSLPEILGKTDADFYPSVLAQKYQQDDRWVLETGKTLETTEDHVTAMGERLYVQVIKSPIHDANGEIVGTQGIFWDITERKRAEEELRRSQERFELAVLGSQDGMYDWDVEANHVWYSPRVRTMLGYDEHEFPNRPGETEKRVHPDDHARWRATLDGHVTGLADHVELEYRMRHKDGSYRWVRDRGVALRRADGKAYRIAGSREDITERKQAEEALRQSEERYRSVIAAMQGGIVLVDASGGIRTCNSSAERILGLSADQMMGRTVLDPRWRAIHEDGSPFLPETFPVIVSLHTSKPCFNVVMGVHKPSGELTWISINSQPLFRPNEATAYAAVASFSDITERKRIEERLQQITGELACARQLLQEARILPRDREPPGTTINR